MSSKPSTLKIFSDTKYLSANRGHVVMLYPFWGPNPEDPRDPNSKRFECYAQTGHEYFSLVSLEEADIAIVPHEWISSDVNHCALQLADDARRYGKRVVVFFNHDSDEKIDIENSVIFRTSFYRSTRCPNEFAFPAWSEDFLERYLNGNLPLREKRTKPVIGYCGYRSLKAVTRLDRWRYAIGSRPWASRLSSSFGFEMINHAGARLRSQAIYAFSHSKEIETNFLIRDGFWGGAVRNGRFDAEVAQQLRREFVQNIVTSDYVLCARGGGNFSYRLYETLNCGRIPVLIDTDCVLPYDDLINWRQYFVWVNENDLSDIAKQVATFHEELSPQDFKDLQVTCRQLWEKWLSPHGFFANFHRHFE